MKTYVLYHANCSDGFCAAWLFHHAYPYAEFIPVQYNQPIPDIEDGSEVFIVDFSYPRKDMVHLCSRMHSLLVLDHHKTSAEDCKGLAFCVFDMDKSGARLAWEYLLGQVVHSLPESRLLVDYTEDRDLWNWVLPDSKEVNAAIRSYPMEFDTWDYLSYMAKQQLFHEGKAILRYRQRLVDQHVRHGREVEIGPYKGRGVYCSSSEIISDIGHDLAEDADFGLCWFDVEDETGRHRVFSLRSREGGADVGTLAKTFGGGGHKHAAGFRMPI